MPVLPAEILSAPITRDLLDELRDLSDKVPPGPWETDGHATVSTPDTLREIAWCGSSDIAEYIAAVQPDALAGLLDLVAGLQSVANTVNELRAEDAGELKRARRELRAAHKQIAELTAAGIAVQEALDDARADVVAVERDARAELRDAQNVVYDSDWNAE